MSFQKANRLRLDSRLAFAGGAIDTLLARVKTQGTYQGAVPSLPALWSLNERGCRFILARHIRELRAVRKISQEVLAELAELHRTYISSIEWRERNVSIDTVERIAQALGVDVAALLAAA